MDPLFLLPSPFDDWTLDTLYLAVRLPFRRVENNQCLFTLPPVVYIPLLVFVTNIKTTFDVPRFIEDLKFCLFEFSENSVDWYNGDGTGAHDLAQQAEALNTVYSSRETGQTTQANSSGGGRVTARRLERSRIGGLVWFGLAGSYRLLSSKSSFTVPNPAGLDVGAGAVDVAREAGTGTPTSANTRRRPAPVRKLEDWAKRKKMWNVPSAPNRPSTWSALSVLRMAHQMNSTSALVAVLSASRPSRVASHAKRISCWRAVRRTMCGGALVVGADKGTVASVDRTCWRLTRAALGTGGEREREWEGKRRTTIEM
ncbi:hypothetical protein BKA62DRAFT_787205 [Auriculariales sp. MPI-PUGE-AT-0066]|nr:hypothetical protein BKA62DRAFT_787205 [Auriculariales sp. MPI-PUGE-AT-0066]